MNRDTGTSTIGALLTELRDEGTTLLRQEVALAKAELGETAARGTGLAPAAEAAKDAAKQEAEKQGLTKSGETPVPSDSVPSPAGL